MAIVVTEILPDYLTISTIYLTIYLCFHVSFSNFLRKAVLQSACSKFVSKTKKIGHEFSKHFGFHSNCKYIQNYEKFDKFWFVVS